MRIEKIAILDEVVARVKDSDYCFIVNHGGVTVSAFAKLRKDLRALDSRLLVVKNTFLAKVAKEKGWSDEVNAMFAGPLQGARQERAPCDVAHALQGAGDSPRARSLREGQEGRWRSGRGGSRGGSCRVTASSSRSSSYSRASRITGMYRSNFLQMRNAEG